MSVTPLHAGIVIGDSVKDEFLSQVAAVYDQLVADGHKPDGLTFCVSQLRGPSHSSWVVVGDAADAVSATLARACFSINRVANQAADGSR